MEIAQALDVSVTALLPAAAPPAGKTDDKSVLDDPEVEALAPLVADLNSDGRRVLASIARTMAKDPKLGKADRNRK
jgi:hypothetical protein